MLTSRDGGDGGDRDSIPKKKRNFLDTTFPSKQTTGYFEPNDFDQQNTHENSSSKDAFLLLYFCCWNMP